MEAIRAGVVRVVQQPAVVARQAVLHRKDHAGEFAGRDADTLLPDQSAHRVKGQEPGNDLLGHLDGGLRLRDARVGVIGLGLRDRAGCVDLPRQRRPQVRILGQQVVKDRRAGAGLTDDEDRGADWLGGDFGVLFAPAITPSRLVRARMMSRWAISTPIAESRASLTRPSATRSRPGCQPSSPKSSKPACSRAAATRRSGLNRSCSVMPALRLPARRP